MKPVICAVMALTISACNTAWHRPDMMSGPTEQAQFARDQANCRLVARGVTPGFVPTGSPTAVAGSAVGYTIGTSVAMTGSFNDCMIAAGYLPGTGNVMDAVQARCGDTINNCYYR